MAVSSRPERSTGPTDLVWAHEQLLGSEAETGTKTQIPKWVVPTLPARFERTWLGVLPEGAVDSYRDMAARTDSAHINEFPGYWELHVDSFNPHYYPVSHVLADTDVVPALREWGNAVALTSTQIPPSARLVAVGALVPLRLSTAVANRTISRVTAGVDRLLEDTALG